MPRILGVLPVAVLSLGATIGAVLGLHLSHDESRSLADELGCRHVVRSHPQAGVDKEICSYHGDRIVILTLAEGEHALYPPDLPATFIIGTAGDVIVGCQLHDDCVAIHRQFPGDLDSGPLLGLSLIVGQRPST